MESRLTYCKSDDGKLTCGVLEVIWLLVIYVNDENMCFVECWIHSSPTIPPNCRLTMLLWGPDVCVCVRWGGSIGNRLEIQIPEVQTPSRAQEKFVRVFPSPNVVLTCCQCAQPLFVYVCTHKNDHVRTLKIL